MAQPTIERKLSLQERSSFQRYSCCSPEPDDAQVPIVHQASACEITRGGSQPDAYRVISGRQDQMSHNLDIHFFIFFLHFWLPRLDVVPKVVSIFEPPKVVIRKANLQRTLLPCLQVLLLHLPLLAMLIMIQLIGRLALPQLTLTLLLLPLLAFLALLQPSVLVVAILSE